MYSVNAKKWFNFALFIMKSRTVLKWKIAGDFVAEFSSTAKNIDSDKLIMRAAPQTDDEFSLSVAKLESDGQQQIFLDVHCTQTSLGDDLCRSSKIKNLRQSFAPYLQSQLASQH